MHVMACECCYSMKKSIITFNWNMFEWSKQSPRTYKQARALEYSNTQVHNSKVLRLHTSLFIKWLWSCTFDFRFLYFGDIFSWNLLIFFASFIGWSYMLWVANTIELFTRITQNRIHQVWIERLKFQLIANIYQTNYHAIEIDNIRMEVFLIRIPIGFHPKCSWIKSKKKK